MKAPFNENLFGDIIDDIPVNRLNIFEEFLCILEGFKTKFKNLHWSAYSNSIHNRIDELNAIISSYLDLLAEEVQGIYSQFRPNFLKGIEVTSNCACESLVILIEKTYNFYKNIPSDTCCVGIKSECESFITNLHKYKYLFSLCKKSSMD